MIVFKWHHGSEGVKRSFLRSTRDRVSASAALCCWCIIYIKCEQNVHEACHAQGQTRSEEMVQIDRMCHLSHLENKPESATSTGDLCRGISLCLRNIVEFRFVRQQEMCALVYVSIYMCVCVRACVRACIHAHRSLFWLCFVLRFVMGYVLQLGEIAHKRVQYYCIVGECCQSDEKTSFWAKVVFHQEPVDFFQKWCDMIMPHFFQEKPCSSGSFVGAWFVHQIHLRK